MLWLLALRCQPAVQPFPLHTATDSLLCCPSPDPGHQNKDTFLRQVCRFGISLLLGYKDCMRSLSSRLLYMLCESSFPFCISTDSIDSERNPEQQQLTLWCVHAGLDGGIYPDRLGSPLYLDTRCLRSVQLGYLHQRCRTSNRQGELPARIQQSLDILCDLHL